MSNTNINIRTDSEVKAQAQALFAQFGLDMTTAVNMFLRQAIRERAIPLDLRLDAGDPFFTHPVNRARLLETIEEYRSGKGETVVKTMEELEAMERE